MLEDLLATAKSARNEHHRLQGTETLEAALLCLESAADQARTPAGRAVCAGLASDRVGYAVIGGYDAALRRLLAPRVFSRCSFCVTEEGGGGHPSTMQTRLEERDEKWFATGTKSFATLATHAETFIVIGTIGEEDGGRKHLRAAVFPSDAPGLRITERAPLPFTPEIPHAALTLTDAPAAEILEGDGYDRYVKPFRTVEDAHVTLAVLAYALSEASARGWEDKDLRASIKALIPIADDADPSAAETHLRLDVELDRARNVLDALPWNDAPALVRDRWFRDRPILEVADRVRKKRTARAHERLGR
jgi:hypothetical protein